MIYSSFLSDTVSKTGMVPMPNTQTETLEGGHCVLMIGYSDSMQTFLCVNSWGPSWGNRGLFSIPYLYVTNPDLAADFCALNFIY
jgi:C1A family cysteine protease